MVVLDLSQLADGVENPQLQLLTPVGSQPIWENPGAHSAIKVPGRDLARHPRGRVVPYVPGCNSGQAVVDER